MRVIVRCNDFDHVSLRWRDGVPKAMSGDAKIVPGMKP